MIPKRLGFHYEAHSQKDNYLIKTNKSNKFGGVMLDFIQWFCIVYKTEYV